MVQHILSYTFILQDLDEGDFQLGIMSIATLLLKGTVSRKILLA